MNKGNLIILLAVMLLLANCQSSKKSKGQDAKTNDGFLMSIVNTILGGPYDAPISTRLMNKVGHVATVLFGSIFAYFKWFRQRKNRREKINEYIGEEKQKFALIAEAEAKTIGEKVAEKIIYELNSDKARMIAIKSGNGTINFNIKVDVDEITEESILIYDVKMSGSDPEGNSKFTGVATFKDRLLELRLEQTYDKSEKKNEYHPICLF